MSKCFIITAFINGSIKSITDIGKNDYIICADGGYRLAKKENIVPNLLIGDFDSFNEALPQNIKTFVHPIEKDDTDTMLCVKYAAEKNFDEICIVGGIGGRLDHTLSNLQTLAWMVNHWKENKIIGKKISMTDYKNHIMLICHETVILRGYPGQKISLISFSDECTGITAKGLKWELTDATLTNSFPLGISNEFLGETAEISVAEGLLLVVSSRD